MNSIVSLPTRFHPPLDSLIQFPHATVSSPSGGWFEFAGLLLMDPYLKRYNNYVNIPKILTASGKRMSDLPTLPQYCHPTGQSFLCWNSVLGRCFRGPRCRFARGHMKKGEFNEAFADSVTDVISKGVLHFINLPLGEGGDSGSPRNKRKGGGVGAPAES